MKHFSRVAVYAALFTTLPETDGWFSFPVLLSRAANDVTSSKTEISSPFEVAVGGEGRDEEPSSCSSWSISERERTYRSSGGLNKRSTKRRKFLKQTIADAAATITTSISLGSVENSFFSGISSTLSFGSSSSILRHGIKKMHTRSSSLILRQGIKKMHAEIEQMVEKDPEKGPAILRLAWHASGTYNLMKQEARDQGEAVAHSSFEQKLSSNPGLAMTAMAWINNVHERHERLISLPDMYALAGVAAVRGLGGPNVKWRVGRPEDPKDATTSDQKLVKVAELGNRKKKKRSDADVLRDLFNRMGFDDRAIVALASTHALGRLGPSTTFNNSYFTLLRGIKKRQWDRPFDYVKKGLRITVVPSDVVLLSDQSFRKWINRYSNDNTLYRSDFSAYFQQLLELGCRDLKEVDIV